MSKKLKIALASTLPRAKGSQEKMFNAQGQLNASNMQDWAQAIATLMELASTQRIMTDGQAAEAETAAVTHRQMVLAALDSKEELAALGETLAEQLSIAADRDGFARRFMVYQDLVDGAIPNWRVNTKSVTATMVTDKSQVHTTYARDNVLYPDEFYLSARPFIERKDSVRTSGDLLESKYNEALEALMVQEDRMWKRLADRLVGVDNPNLNIAGRFTPSAFTALTSMVNDWGITPRFALMASNLWTDICADSTWADIIDPVSQQELLLTGKLGVIHGVELISDHFRHQNHKVIDSGQIYVVGAPEMHGGFTDRGGVIANPIDETTEKVPGAGWAMHQLTSMIIANSRSLARGVRV